MPAIDFAELRRQVPLVRVLELLDFVLVTRHGAQVRGPCPLHGATQPTSRAFSAHLERHVWHCFRCGAGGNALDLWRAATKLPLYEAALDLCRRLNLEVPWRTPAPRGGLPPRH